MAQRLSDWVGATEGVEGEGVSGMFGKMVPCFNVHPPVSRMKVGRGPVMGGGVPYLTCLEGEAALLGRFRLVPLVALFLRGADALPAPAAARLAMSLSVIFTGFLLRASLDFRHCKHTHTQTQSLVPGSLVLSSQLLCCCVVVVISCQKKLEIEY